jgi:transcriptional regulator with XRE-family HTH domain
MSMPQPGGAEELGLWLRRRREMAGLTREDVAERSSVSVRAISDLERGRTGRPHPRSVRAIAATLGLPRQVADQLIAGYRACWRQRAERPAVPQVADKSSPVSIVFAHRIPSAVTVYAVGNSAELAFLEAMLEYIRHRLGLVQPVAGSARRQPGS